MEIFAKILVFLVSLEHFYILYIQIFSWETLGKKVFKNTLETSLFSKTKGIAANLGLYNGFLATGLLFGLCFNKIDFLYFFLACVIVAGIFGAIRSDKNIFFKQALPAFFAFIFVYFSYGF